MKDLKDLHDYVRYDLDIYRRECNFTDEELKFFNYCAKGHSNVRIASEIPTSISTVYRIASDVKEKIFRVDQLLADGLIK